ncbi:MAG: lipid II:glycine glycyltransferase FemX [Bacteroidia bacterium]
MNTVKICNLKDIEIDLWEKFLLKSENPSYFASTDYFRAFNSDIKIIILLNHDNTIIAGLPVFIENLIPVVGRFMKIARIESEVIFAKSVKNDDKISIKESLFKSAIFFLQKYNVANLYITSKIRSNDSVVYQSYKCNLGKCGTFLIDLTKDIEIIYKNFSKGHKSSIQKAIKLEVEVSIYKSREAIPYISEYLKTQEKLYQRRKDSFSILYLKDEKFLTNIFDTKYNNVYFAVARYKNQTAATGVFVSIANKIFYYSGNSDYELVRESQAANILQYEMIKHAKSLGLEIFDLGGADIEINPDSEEYGVTVFKKGFGGDLAVYDYGKIIVNPFTSNIISKLIKLQKNSVFVSIYKRIRK